MDQALAIPWPAAALALSSVGATAATEISVVSLLDGVVGDPITWIDQPGSADRDGRSTAHRAPGFRSVAADIRAHLPDGAVVVRGANSGLMLIRRILPLWRPAMVLDTLSLARRAGLPICDDAETAAGTCGAAGRALATARLLLLVADVLPGIGFSEGRVPYPA